MLVLTFRNFRPCRQWWQNAEILAIDCMQIHFNIFSNEESIVIQYVTGFGKTCIVHTSNFSTSVTHKIYFEWWMDVKLSEIVELLLVYHPWTFHIYIPFPVDFMNLQMSKSGCVNYARFPKSGHILYLIKVSNIGNSDDYHL